MLLSFERPAFAAVPRERVPPSRSLKTAQKPQQPPFDKRAAEKRVSHDSADAESDHRQDSKGTRWMPWHQESMKGVNGCDKPR